MHRCFASFGHSVALLSTECSTRISGARTRLFLCRFRQMLLVSAGAGVMPFTIVNLRPPESERPDMFLTLIRQQNKD